MTIMPITLSGVPARVVSIGPPEQAGMRGTVLVYHGLGSRKEARDPELAVLARFGLLAVGLDSVGHGERRYADFEARFGPERAERDVAGADADFFAVVRATAAETSCIIDALVDRGWAYPNKIGVAGGSMGGYIVYAAVLADLRVQAATPIAGSPQWPLPWSESPHRSPERFFPTALLSQTGECDTTVPPALVQAFHRRLAPYYGGAADRLQDIEYPGIGHTLPPSIREQAWQRAATWHLRFLSDVHA